MKALFLIFHGFNPANGISKKIHSQVNALKGCGVDTHLCYLKEINGRKLRMVDTTILQDYGSGVKGKIFKRIEYFSIINYAINQKIDYIYIRSDHNANPFTLWMVYKLRQAGIKMVMEIPTYPYEQEYTSRSGKCKLVIDKYFRKLFAKQLSYIVTFSNYKTIFGVPTIQISNGIDFNEIKLKQAINNTHQELHFIGVAEIHYWHGFDRLIQGFVNYYANSPSYKVYFHIVGNFSGEREKNDILPLIKRNSLEKYIILHGAKHGQELDYLFDKADMAIGSLARHRSGITYIKTLKNREYAARGLSFIYSEIDSDFESKPYIMKVPANDSPINIRLLIEFYNSQTLLPLEIRNSIQSLSWIEQMKTILKFTNSNSYANE